MQTPAPIPMHSTRAHSGRLAVLHGEHARALERRVSQRASVSAPQTIEDACAFAWLQCAALDGTPPARRAGCGGSRCAARRGRRLAALTSPAAARSSGHVADRAAPIAVAEERVLVPYGVVLAFCVDVAACGRRLRGAVQPRPPGRRLTHDVGTPGAPARRAATHERPVNRKGVRASPDRPGQELARAPAARAAMRRARADL